MLFIAPSFCRCSLSLAPWLPVPRAHNGCQCQTLPATPSTPHTTKSVHVASCWEWTQHHPVFKGPPILGDDTPECPYNLTKYEYSDNEECGTSGLTSAACKDSSHDEHEETLLKCPKMCLLADHPEWNVSKSLRIQAYSTDLPHCRTL